MDATPPQPEDDRLLSPGGPTPAAPAYGDPVPGRDRTGVLTAAGLVIAGLVVGAVGTLALGHSSSGGTTTLTNAGNQQGFGGPGQLPQGGAPQGGDRQGGFGGPPGGAGLDGEWVQGTLTALGSSTVTVRTSSGTATYAVTSSSELVRDGRRVSLSGLKTGEPVFLHVYPLNGRTVVERLFAGTPPQGGPGGPPPAGARNG